MALTTHSHLEQRLDKVVHLFFLSVFVACLRVSFTYIIIIIITSQFWLGNIHLSWDVVINKITLGGLICSLKSFLQLNMCQELQIF